MALKQLLWLRGRLTLRGFTRSKSTVFGAIIGLLFMGPLALVLAGVLGLGLARLPVHDGENLLRGVLFLVAVVWTVGPLLGFQLNESQDITRLFIYPVPVHKLFLGVVLGCLLDLTSLLLLPTLIAVMVGAAFHGAAGALMAALAMLVFLFQTLAVSQAITLALQGVLRSRKWRDMALVIIPLFWISWQVGVQSLSRSAGKTDWKALLASPLWEWGSLLPPGLAARAVGAGLKGMWPLSVAYLGALGLVTVATFVVSSWLVARAYRGETVGIPAPTETKLNAARPRARTAAYGVIPAIFQKEWALFVRDPYFRLLAMNIVAMLVIGVVTSLSRGKSAEGMGTTVALWVATSLALVQQTRLAYNIFGAEANAAALLFAYPIRRRDLLIGKNLANLSAILPLNLVAVTVLCVALKRLDMLGMLVAWMLSASLVMTAVGNAISLMLPQRVNLNGLRTRPASAGEGFLIFGVSLAALILYAPPLVAVLAPSLWIGSGWLWLTAPLALGYAVGLYFLSLRLTEPWLLDHEPAIIVKVARPES